MKIITTIYTTIILFLFPCYSQAGEIRTQSDLIGAMGDRSSENLYLMFYHNLSTPLDLSVLDQCTQLKTLWLYPQLFHLGDVRPDRQNPNFGQMTKTIPALPKLEALHMRGFPLLTTTSQNEIDQFFSKLNCETTLRILDLKGLPTLSIFFKLNVDILAKFVNLEELYISDHFIVGDFDPASLKYLFFLKELPHLKILDVNNNRGINQTAIDFLLTLPIENLNISNCNYGYEIEMGKRSYPVSIQGQPNPTLQTLNLSGLNLQSVMLGTVTPNLITLVANRIDFTLLNLGFLAELVHLEKLSMKSAILNADNLNEIKAAHLTELKHLDLSHTPIKGIAFDSLAPNLETLILQESKVSPSDLKAISKLQFLQELNLQHTGINSKAISHLSKLKGLKKLNLNSTNLQNASLELLAGLSELEELHLLNTQLTLEDFHKLRTLTQLKILQVGLQGNPKITPEEFDALKAHLPNCDIK